MKQTADFFISTERNGRLVKNLREFSDANPDICHKAVNGQPFMIDPRALVLVPNWNCREMGLGEAYYKWHCCKVSDEAAFCLIQRPYISKTLLT
ncbi:hypothetical protein AAGP52_26115, partial [Klebsiella pneumoniae]